MSVTVKAGLSLRFGFLGILEAHWPHRSYKKVNKHDRKLEAYAYDESATIDTSLFLIRE